MMTIKEQLKRFGSLVRDRRKEMGITLHDLASQADISYNYISELERGKKVPSDEFVDKLAHFLEIPGEALFSTLGRTPVTVRKEYAQSNNLRSLLSEIMANDELTREEKDQIYLKMLELYKDLSAKE
ncbi:helix-turn-helix domain-containing protein [Peribacillus kribbensis]|uniref:helix-turn-helix domain-containing protein n=1 Tax=Peribacillus kribbensis TaxID=356658 RepID=UPI0003FEEB21|nr:helix-turn-helix transcriptional regulator [Peribacillus kribbensis]